MRDNEFDREPVVLIQDKVAKVLAVIAGVSVGATGALGMPDLLSPRALTAALTSWHSDLAPKIAHEPVLANDAKAPAPVSMPAPREPIEMPVATAAPQAVLQAVADPVRADVAPSAPPAIVFVTASVGSHPAPEIAGGAETIEAPKIETPKAKTPKIETLAVAPAKAELPAPIAAPPKLSEIPLPRPKPPLTPAEQLDLHGKERARAEKCLAQAVYFEARNEAARGQIAVAQVVMNRVFSPYYPKDVCSVVYQNAHRLLGCQFTFACDGQSEAIRERGAWARAQRIAKQTLDAKVWLPEVAKSTHYHATYVRPIWAREMKQMVRYGTHIFYRPHRWGSGSNEPGWGLASVEMPKTAKVKQ
jgi:hypothetical protein